MNTTPTRTRVRGSATPSQVNTEAANGDWFQEGDEGFSTAEKLQQGRKDFLPRFYLKVDETAEIVILDEGKGFFVHEYEIYDAARKRMNYETVNKDTGYDPLEQLVGVDTRFKDASYVMYLTCIDLRPYVDKNGNQKYFTKKLLPVKRAQMKKFKRYLEQYGTYRGMLLRMTRDDPKGAKIGDPEINPIDGKALLTEEDIFENFKGPAVMSKDGKTVYKEENADCYAFDYRTILAPASPEELAKRWGAPYNPGSSQFNNQVVESQQGTALQSRPSTVRAAGSPPPLLSRGTSVAASPAKEAQSTIVRPSVENKKSLVTKPAQVVDDSMEDEDEIPFDVDEETIEAEEEWYGGDESEE